MSRVSLFSMERASDLKRRNFSHATATGREKPNVRGREKGGNQSRSGAERDRTQKLITILSRSS